PGDIGSGEPDFPRAVAPSVGAEAGDDRARGGAGVAQAQGERRVLAEGVLVAELDEDAAVGVGETGEGRAGAADIAADHAVEAGAGGIRRDEAGGCPPVVEPPVEGRRRRGGRRRGGDCGEGGERRGEEESGAVAVHWRGEILSASRA